MAKKEPKAKVKCIDCIHSELTQWDNNPVIAKCPFLLYRQVANAIRECNKYQKSYHVKNIKKLTHNI